MPGATVPLGFPFPLPTDLVVDVDDAIEDLANAVDDSIVGDSAAVTLGVGMVTVFEGSLVYRRGRVGIVHLAATTPAGGKAAGVALLTTPAGYRPPQVIRGIGWDQTAGTFFACTLTAAGVLYSEVNLTAAHNVLVSMAFPI